MTVTMMQPALPNSLPEGYLECANPDFVEGYISIEEILKGRSTDFGTCYVCKVALCKHALDQKRQDESYKVLVQHFRDGGLINQPICYDKRLKKQANGHHRLVAALDAGFTHVPIQDRWGVHEDWDNTDFEKYGFKMNRWGDGLEEI